jgi:hypothetical protein
MDSFGPGEFCLNGSELLDGFFCGKRRKNPSAFLFRVASLCDRFALRGYQPLPDALPINPVFKPERAV